MPRNGQGTYSLPQPPFVAGTVISSSAVNSDLSDIASALTGSLPRDGQAGMIGVLKLPDGSTAVPSLAFNNDATTGFSRNVVNAASQIGVSIAGTSIGNFTNAGWTGAVTGALSGNGSVPIGTVIDYAGATAPKYWYLCYGQAVSRTTFSDLFTAIGTTYGSGDGSTTFNLPDLRGSAIFGLDNMGGSVAGRLTSTYFGSDPTLIGDRGGSQNHTQTLSELVAHSHPNTLHDPGHTHPLNANSENSNTSTPGGSFALPQTAAGSMASATTGITITNANEGGGNPFAIVPPALVMNKIIYAGA